MKGSVRKAVLAVLLSACVTFSIHAGVQAANQPIRKQVLFICTGNYYRSRFAEALFNQKAGEAHPDWKAVSRGLEPVSWQHGISPLAQRELIKRGVPPQLWKHDPKALTKEDLEKSDYIILMDEAEHRPMLEKQFPKRDERKIHYWHIGESGKMNPAKACQAMSTDIDKFFQTTGH